MLVGSVSDSCSLLKAQQVTQLSIYRDRSGNNYLYCKPDHPALQDAFEFCTLVDKMIARCFVSDTARNMIYCAHANASGTVSDDLRALSSLGSASPHLQEAPLSDILACALRFAQNHRRGALSRLRSFAFSVLTWISKLRICAC